MTKSRFVIKEWKNLTLEQKGEAMSLIQRNISDIATYVIEPNLNHPTQTPAISEFNGFCLLDGKKAFAFITATANKIDKELCISFAVSPLNKSKKEFVKAKGKSPFEILMKSAVKWGEKKKCTHLMYSTQSKDAQIAIRKRGANWKIKKKPNIFSKLFGRRKR